MWKYQCGRHLLSLLIGGVVGMLLFGSSINEETISWSVEVLNWLPEATVRSALSMSWLLGALIGASALNGVLLLIWAFCFTWVFPLQARFENPVNKTLKNALYMSVRHLPFTVPMTILNGIPVICIALGSFTMALAVPIYIVIGFSLTARGNAVLLEKAFKKYVADESEEEKNDFLDIIYGYMNKD